MPPTKPPTKPPLSSEARAALEANFAAIKRAVAEVRDGGAVTERCRLCDQPIVVTVFPSEPPHTSFVTGCPCGACRGQLKGI